MLVSAATPSELSQWFHREEHGQRVLCLLLAPSRTDQAKLVEVIQEVCLIDSAIGDKIALLLVDGRADYRLGFHEEAWLLKTIPARALTPIPGGQKPVLPLRYATGLTKASREARRRGVQFANDLALQSARFVPDFLSHFCISPHELPCLCAFVRGVLQPVVICLGSDWGTDSIWSLLTKIRTIVDAEPDVGSEILRLFRDVEETLPKVEHLERKIERRSVHLSGILYKILMSHGASEADIACVAELAADGFRSTEDFDRALDTLEIARSDKLKRDSRIGGARKVLEGIQALRARLQSLDEAYGRALLDLEQRAAQLNASRERLTSSFGKLNSSRLSPAKVTIDYRATRAWLWLEALNLSGDLAEKAYFVINLLKRLAGM